MVILSNFAETLFSLMTERGLNAPSLAQHLQTDRSNITRYLNGQRLPRYEVFVKMIEFFGISADVLLGLTDYAKTNNFLPVASFDTQLRKVMKETNTTQYALKKQAGFSSGSIHNWLTGKDLPSADKLAELAQFMDVSVDYLLGRVN